MQSGRIQLPTFWRRLLVLLMRLALQVLALVLLVLVLL